MAGWCRAETPARVPGNDRRPRESGGPGDVRSDDLPAPGFPLSRERRGADRSAPGLPRLLSGRLPFFYGWVILGCLCCAGFSRQGPAVATLSIFVEPLTREFGWSRAALSGAVSLGGVLAALTSPLIGPLVDRYGSRAALSLAVLATGSGDDAAVADPVAARLLPAVLHRPDGLGRPVRARDLWRR